MRKYTLSLCSDTFPGGGEKEVTQINWLWLYAASSFGSVPVVGGGGRLHALTGNGTLHRSPFALLGHHLVPVLSLQRAKLVGVSQGGIGWSQVPGSSHLPPVWDRTQLHAG